LFNPPLIPGMELQCKKIIMIKIKLFVLLITAMALVPGCKKYNETAPYPTAMMSTNKTPAENLTQKPWRLLSYGFDRNKNGLVDTEEESIRNCEKDNSYTFNKDGSGVVAENAMICDANNPVDQFAWTLTNNDTVLDFYYGKANIIKLDADYLYITSSSTDDIKLLLIYAH
jgi:hypothetical protein